MGGRPARQQISDEVECFSKHEEVLEQSISAVPGFPVMLSNRE
jgi:hypothetical protein